MNGPPFLLVLLFLSSCHGGEQDGSSPSGILTTTKAQKLKAPLEVLCPEPTDIEPCECSIKYGDLYMDCSKVQDEDQLRKVFSASFPTTHFYMFNMSYNEGVKVLEDGVFGDVSFKYLDIYNSVLVAVSYNALRPSFTTLRYIDIWRCQLTTFPFERLSEFTSLGSLGLDDNKIRSLPPLSSTSLYLINLSNNLITHLPPDVFTHLPAVQSIFLGWNYLTEMTPETFSGLPNLDYVNLFDNNISYLQSLTFDLVTSRPATLSLSFNNIDIVEVDAFKGLQENSTIYMSSNALVTLVEEVWRPLFEKSITVHLSGNPLACGCDVAWLVRNPQLLPMAEDGHCTDGTLLTDLDPTDFDHCG